MNWQNDEDIMLAALVGEMALLLINATNKQSEYEQFKKDMKEVYNENYKNRGHERVRV